MCLLKVGPCKGFSNRAAGYFDCVLQRKESRNLPTNNSVGSFSRQESYGDSEPLTLAFGLGGGFRDTDGKKVYGAAHLLVILRKLGKFGSS